MAAKDSSKGTSTRAPVKTPTQVGPKAYALGILGNALAPTVTDGQCAIFDPDGGPPLKGDIAAIWHHGAEHPGVFRLALAVPPPEVCGEELGGILMLETLKGRRVVNMDTVREVHRMVAVAEDL